jgi:hypothetical protein
MKQQNVQETRGCFYIFYHDPQHSRDSAASTATSYGLDGQGVGV